jgi:hypothetical protein|nr:MAG TPA: hypothetical protein [Caudoviricetes sp.]
MKYFRMSYDEVVFKRSYLNLLLLNAAIPSIKPLDEDNEDEPQSNNNTNQVKPKRKSYAKNDNGNSFFASLM